MYNSVEEALLTRDDLTQKINDIDRQLGERKAYIQMPGTTTDELNKYQEWRVRACKAKAVVTNKLRKTKQWLRIEREKRMTTRAEAVTLLAGLYTITKSLVSKGAQITSEEQALIDDVGVYLSNN